MNDQLRKYYEVLELQPGASLTEVKRAYRELAQIYHPDRFQGREDLTKRAGEKLKQINQAYEEIKNHYSNYKNTPSSTEEPSQNHVHVETKENVNQNKASNTYSSDQVKRPTSKMVDNLILQSSDRLVFLSIATAGIYTIYWFFKTWLFFKQFQNLKINAILCSIFSAFTIFSLSKRVLLLAEEVDHKGDYKPSNLLAMEITLGFLANKLSGAVGLIPYTLYVFPILPIHKSLMIYVQRIYPDYKEREFFSGGAVGWSITGLLTWGLLFSAINPSESNQAKSTKVITNYSQLTSSQAVALCKELMKQPQYKSQIEEQNNNCIPVIDDYLAKNPLVIEQESK